MLNVAVESLVHSLETAIRCQCIAKGFLGQEHPCRDQIIFSFESFCYFLTSQLEWSEYWWVVPSGKLYLKWTLEISVSGAVLDEDIPRLRSEPRMLKLAAKAANHGGLESHHFRKCLENCTILYLKALHLSRVWHASPLNKIQPQASLWDPNTSAASCKLLHSPTKSELRSQRQRRPPGDWKWTSKRRGFSFTLQKLAHVK